MATGDDGPSKKSDLWVAIALAICGLIFAAYIPLAWGPPSMAELVPAEGPLTSYSLYRERVRRGRWRAGVLYAPKERFAPIAGDAVKSYGLWVDGVEIESPETWLDIDHFASNVFFPLFGLGISAFGCRRAWVIRRQLLGTGRATS